MNRVIIVGGGAAGMMAAVAAADNGKQVCLIEKNENWERSFLLPVKDAVM